MPSATTSRTSASLLAGLTLLAGCNGGGDGAPQATTISGTAAVGAPLSAATIDLRCQGGATATLMTEADGDWSYTVPSSQLPCAVRASGGVASSAANTQTLYSLTLGNGSSIVANATPLTTLVLADVANATPGDAWFATLDATALQALANGAPASVTELVQWLRGLGYAVPAGDFNPFTLAFEPESGNPYDDLLEQIKVVLAANGSSLDAAVAQVASATLHFSATAGGNYDPSVFQVQVSDTGSTFTSTAGLIGNYSPTPVQLTNVNVGTIVPISGATITNVSLTEAYGGSGIVGGSETIPTGYYSGSTGTVISSSYGTLSGSGSGAAVTTSGATSSGSSITLSGH